MAKLGRSKTSKWILPGVGEPTGLEWWGEGCEGLRGVLIHPTVKQSLGFIGAETPFVHSISQIFIDCLLYYYPFSQVFRCSCNKPPQTWWLKTTQIYYFTVLDARSLKWVSMG